MSQGVQPQSIEYLEFLRLLSKYDFSGNLHCVYNKETGRSMSLLNNTLAVPCLLLKEMNLSYFRQALQVVGVPKDSEFFKYRNDYAAFGLYLLAEDEESLSGMGVFKYIYVFMSETLEECKNELHTQFDWSAIRYWYVTNNALAPALYDCFYSYGLTHLTMLNYYTASKIPQQFIDLYGDSNVVSFEQMNVPDSIYSYVQAGNTGAYNLRSSLFDVVKDVSASYVYVSDATIHNYGEKVILDIMAVLFLTHGKRLLTRHDYLMTLWIQRIAEIATLAPYSCFMRIQRDQTIYDIATMRMYT